MRIIEVGFPAGTVSKVGSKERYLHGKTAHSLFVWWARRPFSAMRAVVAASLIPVVDEESMKDKFNLIEELSGSITLSLETTEKARSLLLKTYGRPPRVLDIFGGGGTIALEAGRLGSEAYTLDINPLAYFIQKYILEYSQGRHDLPELVNKYGKRLLDKLKIETQKLYRRGFSANPFEQHIVSLWGRTVECANSICGETISLSGDWWVSKKPNHETLLIEKPDKTTGTYIRELVFNPKREIGVAKWKPIKGIVCPFCGHHYSKNEFQIMTRKSLGDELLCVRSAIGSSKTYVLPTPIDSFYPSQAELKEHISRDLGIIGYPLPNVELPRWSGIVNPALYGMTSYSELLNQRQLAVLLKVIRALRELNEELASSGFSEKDSIAISLALSGFIDQLVDWNCKLSMWIEENEQVGRALSGPGIPMLWRYAEIDPFLSGPANLYDKLNRIVKALQFIPKFSAPMHVYLGSATSLPFSEKDFDAIVTDPAYGDNLFYSVLSECIYIWKRMVFKDSLPEIFSQPSISREEEIVAPVYRCSFFEAMNFYEEHLTTALREACRVLRRDGILSLFFAHGTIEAWELIIRAFRNAGLEICSFWPILIERSARPRGMRSKAINVSVVIVGRHASQASVTHKWSEIKREIDTVVSKFGQELKSFRWKDEDVALACFVKALGVIAKFDKIVDDGKLLQLNDCIKRCAQYIKNLFPSLSLKIRPNNTKKHVI